MKHASPSYCLAYDDKQRVREIVKSKSLRSMRRPPRASTFDKFRRWCIRGISQPDSRTWEELPKVATYFGVRRPVYLWVSHSVARAIESFRANGDWQNCCGHPDLDLDKGVEFGERFRWGETAEEIRRSVWWRSPEKKVSLEHLAMARNATFRVEDVCVWLPEESARMLVEEVDALIWEHRHRQHEKMTEGREAVSRAGEVGADESDSFNDEIV